MKNLYLPLILLFIFKSQAQDLELPFKFGDIPPSEFALKYYEKDSTANAVVLYEKALAKVVVINNNIRLQTTYYYKIKIFNKEGYKYASVNIPLYNSLKSHEKVVKIKAITHNLKNGNDSKIFLNKESIFTSKINAFWKEIKFTLPNIEKGSIIEYTYTKQSPYFYNFTGWYFQSDIPKIYSELHSLIPGNWSYNKRLIGYKTLDVKKQKIKKGCFVFVGLEKAADCEDLTYAMKDVPAFKKEIYLTSKDNYLSHIAFELSEEHSFSGITEKYTKTWKDVDKKFRFEYELGKQLKRIDYTRKLLPPELFSENDTLKKAINIYHYIQNHFKWNEEYHVFKSVDFKKAFKLKTGNATEINIALSNALNAAGIPTKLMLLSTRENGLPTYVHPILSDFNYAIAVVKIKGFLYELDASIKQIPFGMLPFKALNSYGRVMDFKKGSYWLDIKAPRNVKTTAINLKFNEGVLNGFMRITSSAFTAHRKREALTIKGEKKYLKELEDNSEMNELLIESYRARNIDKLEKMLLEDFKISFENESDNENLLIINPYLDRTTSNPFQLKKRNYPVDFGYPETEQYRLDFTVPEGYSISSVPKNMNISLENNDAILVGKSTVNGKHITIDYIIKINKVTFLPKEYEHLKNFYKNIIDLQSGVIILKRQ
jgi:transglutaminase-like putative cysteine protease